MVTPPIDTTVAAVIWWVHNMHVRKGCLCALLCAASTYAQSVGNCSSHVVFGSPTTDGGDGGPATKAQLYAPNSLARDARGYIYIADYGNHKVRVVSPDGVIRTYAGTGVAGYSGDGGPAVAAQLNGPVALAFGPDGRLYIAEGNRIRRVRQDGTIETVAGTGAYGAAGDGGRAVQARIGDPVSIALDATGNLYVAQLNNARVRRIDTAGVITTIASRSVQPAAAVLYDAPRAVAVTPAGTVYVALGQEIASVTPDGKLQIIAGSVENTAAPSDGIKATDATIYPVGLAVDADACVLFATQWFTSQSVWRIRRDGTLEHVANTIVSSGLLPEADGKVVLAGRTQVLRYTPGPPDPTTRLNSSDVVAGDSKAELGDGGPGTAANLWFPGGVATDRAGDVYVTDSYAGRIRKLTPQGGVSTVASGINYPGSIAVTRGGDIYYSLPYGHRVYKIGSDGATTLIAGDGSYGTAYGADSWRRDGKQASAVDVLPTAIAVDGSGALYLAEGETKLLWRITPDGVIHLSARPKWWSSADGIQLASAPSGVIYFADRAEDGTWNLQKTDEVNGPQLVRNLGPFIPVPTSLAVDDDGNAYIKAGDERWIYKSAPNGQISLLTDSSYAGPFNQYSSLALDANGNLYAAESTRAVIVKFENATTCAPSWFPLISAAAMVNAAAYKGSPLAPGEMFTIFGAMIGPPAIAFAGVGREGTLASEVANTQVLIDGSPASLVYASSGQTTAIMPFDAEPGTAVKVQVSVNGFASNAQDIPISRVHMGIFTRDATGRGSGALLNQDFTINSRENPAAKGSVVMLFATGLGALVLPIKAGAIARDAVRTVNTVTAKVDGYDAEVQYAGTSPGLAASIGQVNVRVSEQSRTGEVSVSIGSNVDTVTGGSQAGVTMFVK